MSKRTSREPLAVVIIMAGGGGTRLWPASTPSRPKQLMHLSQHPPHTLLAAAVERARRLAPASRIFVVTSMALAPAIQAAAPELVARNVVVEPRPRSTAPCLALALLHVRQVLREQGHAPASIDAAVVTVLPADHHIPGVEAFTRLVKFAGEHAGRHGNIVTLGIQPTRASTGYGYIERGPEPLVADGDAFVYPALRFVEKPDAARAQIFVDSGRYLWNAGIFIMQLARISAEIERHAARLSGALAPVAWALAAGEDPWPATVAAYDELTAEPIDIAVMEKQRDLCVVPMAIPWTDLGSWAAMREALPKDAHGNVVVAPRTAGIELIDAKNSLVWSEGLDVAVLGVQGVAVVVSGGRVLVCPLERSEEVRRLGERRG